ncbi:conserved hypothetical protein [Desulfofarcimen acetoxidans DSM 771]|uniref:Coenzyme PQQ synthesis D n=1 Tax=Desulfofarcimen acetoxidans (strain ATCC 49208 / DSM 771 / KCTC 5769 / VKM B-1644 / 5575) TaxID=485916 RepID=C8W1A1_DESAS|nr:PqqD family protein [Desulfofarcimen acetoxidans]ACV61546.1 conserved hypothetical protein [Desulfofarcimen acetoxidans DSM 771]
MRIKEGYLLREVAGSHVVVPTGKATLDFTGVITLNETGAFLWKLLADGKTGQELLGALLEEYDTTEAKAKADIDLFLTKLKAADLID